MTPLMLAVSLLTGCSRAPAPPTPAIVPAIQPADATGGPGTYRYACDRIDAEIAAAERRALRYGNDWARWAEIASLWTQRARLTGDYADYGHAEDAYVVAFAIAPAGSGPLLGRAGLHFALHRLEAASADLDVLERQRLDDAQRADVLRMRADILMQRGRMDEAEPLYQQSRTVRDSLQALYGLAQIAWWKGDYERALTRIDEAEALVVGDKPSTRMWLDLQRGLVELDRGHDEAALGHYRDADAEVSGHWLVREHIAEVTHRLGRADEALAMYEQIVLETHNPEFMDAIASILEERGDKAGAARWVAWADAVFTRQLAAYPEAAAGHAIDHYLTHGTDPAFVVKLAERNAALRPNGEALLQLAAAYRRAGRLADADEAQERAAETGFKSPDG